VSLLQRVLGGSVTRLTRAACWLALTGLATMSYSIISPRPLPVIFAMSVGQGVGILAFLCYLLAVVIDVGRHPRGPSLPPGPIPQREADVAATEQSATPH